MKLEYIDFWNWRLASSTGNNRNVGLWDMYAHVKAAIAIRRNFAGKVYKVTISAKTKVIMFESACLSFPLTLLNVFWMLRHRGYLYRLAKVRLNFDRDPHGRKWKIKNVGNWRVLSTTQSYWYYLYLHFLNCILK